MPIEGQTMIYFIMMVAAILAGCATEASVPIQGVQIVAHDLCKISKKLTWDTADTRQTIREVRQHNARWDSRCSKSKPSS